VFNGRVGGTSRSADISVSDAKVVSMNTRHPSLILRRARRRAKFSTAAILAVGAWIVLPILGCTQLDLVFHDPGANPRKMSASPVERVSMPVAARRAPRVMLAADRGASVSTAEESPADAPALRLPVAEPADAEDPRPANENIEVVNSNGVAASGRPSAVTYSAPALATAQLIALATQVDPLGGPGANANALRQAGGTLLTNPQGIVGRAGLAAPSANLGGVLVSRPGLQEGGVGGLGFANPNRNLFTRQRNALSGPNGRCAELARAGFFGGDATACSRAGRR
jgi:hypothetical protein